MSEEEEQFYRTSNIWPDYEIYINGSLMKFDEDYPDASDEQRRQYEIQLNNNALLDIKNNYGDYYLKFLQQNKLVEEESQRQILELQSQRKKDIPVIKKKKEEIIIQIGEMSGILKEQIKYMFDNYNLGSLLVTNVDNFIDNLNMESIIFLDNVIDDYIESLNRSVEEIGKKKDKLIKLISDMYDNVDNVSKKSSESKELVDILNFYVNETQTNILLKVKYVKVPEDIKSENLKYETQMKTLELGGMKYDIWSLMKVFFDEKSPFTEPKLFFKNYDKNTIISYIKINSDIMAYTYLSIITAYNVIHMTLKRIIDLEKKLKQLQITGNGLAQKYFYQPQVKYARLNR